jgi:hypothetical protein
MRLIILIFFLSIVSAQCGISSRNDIYNVCSPGSLLTKELLSNSDQVIINSSDIILLYEINKRHSDYFDPHLLFFNQNLRMISGCYYASEAIDSIKNDTIYGLLNESRKDRISYHRYELPANYKLGLSDSLELHVGRMSDKVIDSISFNKDDLMVSLFVRRAPDPSSGLGWTPYMQNDISFEDYKQPDTLRLPIASLLFNNYDQHISYRYLMSGTNNIMEDEMIVKNKACLDDFFSKLYNYILSRK